jgi:hypothetical protein
MILIQSPSRVSHHATIILSKIQIYAFSISLSKLKKKIWISFIKSTRVEIKMMIRSCFLDSEEILLIYGTTQNRFKYFQQTQREEIDRSGWLLDRKMRPMETKLIHNSLEKRSCLCIAFQINYFYMINGTLILWQKIHFKILRWLFKKDFMAEKYLQSVPLSNSIILFKGSFSQEVRTQIWKYRYSQRILDRIKINTHSNNLNLWAITKGQ